MLRGTRNPQCILEPFLHVQLFKTAPLGPRFMKIINLLHGLSNGKNFPGFFSCGTEWSSWICSPLCTKLRERECIERGGGGLEVLLVIMEWPCSDVRRLRYHPPAKVGREVKNQARAILALIRPRTHFWFVSHTCNQAIVSSLALRAGEIVVS